MNGPLNEQNKYKETREAHAYKDTQSNVVARIAATDSREAHERHVDRDEDSTGRPTDNTKLHDSHLYYIIKYVSRCSQTAGFFLLDRLGRCLKLFVSNVGRSSHEFASHFGLAIFYW